MSDLEQFSELIGDIYDASLDPGLWPGVFVNACKFIGASAATLASHDMVHRGTTVFYNWGLAPGYEKIYAESYCRINPFFPTTIFFGWEQCTLLFLSVFLAMNFVARDSPRSGSRLKDL